MSIEAYEGMQGGGKTYNMVAEVILPCLRMERVLVLSNLHVVDWQTGHETEYCDFSSLDGWRKLTRLIEENDRREPSDKLSIVVCIDEAGVVVPQEVQRERWFLLVVERALQARKSRLDIVYTVQHLERVAKVLRDNTNLVHICRLLWRHPWKRDLDGPLNRRTGRPFRRVWRMEIETVTPDVRHLSEDSRRRGRVEWRAAWFDERVGASFSTFQRIAMIRVDDEEAA